MPAEWSLRLGTLAKRYGLDPAQQEKLSAMLELLERDGRAPTGVRRREDAVEQHLGDSLVGLELEALRGSERIADIGSGAGFPGLPLAVALSASEVVLLESQARWAAYLEAAVAELDVANAGVVHARAEEWEHGIGRHDAVVARAVGPQPVVLEYAAPLLRLEGSVIDWRGRRDPAEERRALEAAQRLGLRRVAVEKVVPFEGARDRHLHHYLKVVETPSGFPRRPGTARKRPLA